MRNLTRRALLAASTLAACSRVPRPERLVSIVRAPSYSTDLAALIRRLLIDHKLAVKGRSVLLKPNLVEFSSGVPINTHPAFVFAAYEAFCSLGAARVVIAEGPGHRRITLDLADSAGYFAAIPGFERKFVDLNLDAVSRIILQAPVSSLTELYLPKTATGFDLLVSLPKMKTHHWVGATLAMKNLFGLVPGAVYGWPKNVLHWAGIDETIADLHRLFPNQFCLVDGIEAMQGNGPILGTAKHAGVVVAGAHPPSVDAACCQIMGIDPARLKYLDFVTRRTGWTAASIHQIAEPVRAVKTPFDLPPGFAELRA